MAWTYMGVSKNSGILKWMVYIGKTLLNLLKLMIWGYHNFRKHPYIYLNSPVGCEISAPKQQRQKFDTLDKFRYVMVQK